MLVEAITRYYKGKSVLTTWDIAAEVLGSMETENYLKIKRVFLSNIKQFVEGQDYINVPREIIINLGVAIPKCFSATKYFQLFTKQGAHKLLKAMDLEEYIEALDDKFDDEEIVVETQKSENEQGAIVEEVVEAVVQSSKENKEYREKAPVEEQVLKVGHSLLSNKVLSLINYIATSKSLFAAKKVANIEIGSVIFNTKIGIVNIITDIVAIPSEDREQDLKYMVQAVVLTYNKLEHQWDIIGNVEFITTQSMGISTNKLIADKGIEFLIGLKTVEKSEPFIKALDGIHELMEQQRKIQEKLDGKLAVIYNMNP